MSPLFVGSGACELFGRDGNPNIGFVREGCAKGWCERESEENEEAESRVGVPAREDG